LSLAILAINILWTLQALYTQKYYRAVEKWVIG